MRAPLAALDHLPVLSTARTRLRRLRPEDAEALYEVFSDPETMRYWSTPPHADPEQTRDSISASVRGFEGRTVLSWGIERESDGRLLGTVTLLPESEQPRAELGYILGREHWGHGYAGEAQRAVVEFAFTELELNRLEADTDPRNAGSLRSLARLGFRREGLLRERWIVAGETTDSVIFGLLASDWATP